MQCLFCICSGPQFADIVMDQCQTDNKLGMDIKDEVGENEVHGKIQSKSKVHRIQCST